MTQFSTKPLAASSWPTAPATPGANDLSPSGTDALGASAGVSPDGTTTIAWTRGGNVEARIRPASGGAFGGIVTLPNSLTSPIGTDVVGGGDNSTTVLWSGLAGSNPAVAGAYRAPGGTTFTATPNAPGTGNSSPVGASDGLGNVPAGWENQTMSGSSYQASALITAAPVITNVNFPSTGALGTPFSYSATVTDGWTPFTAAWTFGDGTTGPLSGSHTYASGGSFNPLLTATDSFGNASTVTRSITIPGGPAATGTATPAPRFTSTVRESNRTWREGRKLATVSRKRRVPLGTKFTFGLGVPATVRLTFTHRLPGRKVNGRCVAPGRSNRGKPACKRTVAAGKLSFSNLAAGTHEISFQGRLSRAKKLAPGAYKVTLSATNASGRASARPLSFTIVRAKRR